MGCPGEQGIGGRRETLYGTSEGTSDTCKASGGQERTGHAGVPAHMECPGCNAVAALGLPHSEAAEP